MYTTKEKNKCFRCIDLFSPYNSHMGKVPFVSALCRCEDWGMER